MYKLFLCLRYLRSRVIAYFAMMAVALCVAMMLIAVSVMNGFLDKIENAAKGLFGDIIVASNSLSGLGRYDEFIAEVTEKVPQVEAASPYILTFGILRVPDQDYRQTLQIAGIRLPERADVTAFEDGLFVQAGVARPSFDPPIDLLLAKLDEHSEIVEQIIEREGGSGDRSQLPPAKAQLIRRLEDAWWMQRAAASTLRRAAPHQGRLAQLRRELDSAEAAARGQFSQEVETLSEQLDELVDQAGYQAPNNRVILGLGIPGLIRRTEQGETVRFIGPGHQVVLWVLPIGRKLSGTSIPANAMRLTVVDDCRTDVFSIDSNMAYVPFRTLQRINNMSAEYDPDDPNVQVTPARCSQIHLKVRDDLASPEALQAVCDRVEALWLDFTGRYPDAVGPSLSASVETWRQRQANVIEPIQVQRTLVVIMFGIISLVSVVLIFVIFYTIVVQKTRDIGVMKSVGASSGGVAQIFLGYGAAVGFVGAILGLVGGYYFVKYINPIQDTVDTWFGYRVWSREWFLFEKIPNQVDPTTAVLIAVSAMAAGLIGALIPAIRAGRMQPVEALRYE